MNETTWQADAKAEAHWSRVERKGAASREYRNRPLCCHCKQRPVESTPGAVLCKTDADEYRRIFGQEP